jgi:hypothetical protein
MSEKEMVTDSKSEDENRELDLRQYDSFAEEVWQTLSRIDVSAHTREIEATAKRPAVGYLPWHRAWIILKNRFPGSWYLHEPETRHEDGTVEVEVKVYITHGGDKNVFITSARLPVMNFYFDAETSPNARKINDSRQRCLVKALAFAGLGLDLWAGGDMPAGKLDDTINEAEVEELKVLIEETGTDEDQFLEWCACDTLEEMRSEKFLSARGLLLAKKRKMDKEQS